MKPLPTTDSIQSIRNELGLDDKPFVYFAFPGIGLLPKCNQTAQERFHSTFAGTGYSGVLELLRANAGVVRENFARFIGAGEDEIAFTQNTTQGLNTAALGYDWHKGDEVIGFQNEYPANIYPWLGLERRGVKTKLLPEAALLDTDQIDKAITKKTRLISVSLVQFGSGIRIELDRLIALVRSKEKKFKKKILLCVDASQYLGVLDFDVKASKVDLLAVSGHKWLLGDFGASFMYVAKDVQDMLYPPVLGAGSVVDEYNYTDYNLELKPGAARYEGGTLNFAGLFGLDASIRLLSLVPAAEKEERIGALRIYTEAKLTEIGMAVYNRSPVSNVSPILSAFWPSHPDLNYTEVAEKAQKAGVHVFDRENRIRIGLHFFHTQAEVDKLVAALAETDPAK